MVKLGKMGKLVLVGLVVSFLAWPQLGTTQALASLQQDSSLQMQSACAGFRNIQMQADGTFILPRAPEARECWGAFTAIQQLIIFTDGQNRPLLGVCGSTETTRIELIRVYERYADVHPEASHLSFGKVVLKALQGAYPCERAHR